MRANTRVGVTTVGMALMALWAANAFGQAPVRSFAALAPLLTPGERLSVRDKSGKTTEGRFVTLSHGELVITHRRWNWRTVQKKWSEATVVRIRHRDSTWNGAAIGAAVGVAAMFVIVRLPTCNRPDDLKCLPLFVAAIPLGLAAGEAVDGRHGRTLYQTPAP